MKFPSVEPRNYWLRDRVKSCLDALSDLELSEDWDQYRDHAKSLAQELLYATTEWEKFYK